MEAPQAAAVGKASGEARRQASLPPPPWNGSRWGSRGEGHLLLQRDMQLAHVLAQPVRRLHDTPAGDRLALEAGPQPAQLLLEAELPSDLDCTPERSPRAHAARRIRAPHRVQRREAHRRPELLRGLLQRAGFVLQRGVARIDLLLQILDRGFLDQVSQPRRLGHRGIVVRQVRRVQRPAPRAEPATGATVERRAGGTYTGALRATGTGACWWVRRGRGPDFPSSALPKLTTDGAAPIAGVGGIKLQALLANLR